MIKNIIIYMLVAILILLFIPVLFAGYVSATQVAENIPVRFVESTVQKNHRELDEIVLTPDVVDIRTDSMSNNFLAEAANDTLQKSYLGSVAFIGFLGSFLAIWVIFTFIVSGLISIWVYHKNRLLSGTIFISKKIRYL